MMKSERLGKLIGMSKEDVEREIDRGMWDILIELNQKNYLTTVCCEGHLKENGSWNAYIGFKSNYAFKEYPYLFSSTKNRLYYYWDGVGEESRQKFLDNLLNWAKRLPVRDLVFEKEYILYIKNKRNSNSREKIAKCSNDFEDIRVLFNKADMHKYDTRIEERILRIY